MGDLVSDRYYHNKENLKEDPEVVWKFIQNKKEKEVRRHQLHKVWICKSTFQVLSKVWKEEGDFQDQEKIHWDYPMKFIYEKVDQRKSHE